MASTRYSVTSSFIESIEYDPVTWVMTVHVRGEDGKFFSYGEVPQPVFESFLAADSKGVFFSRHIRGKFSKPGEEARRRNIPVLIGVVRDDLASLGARSRGYWG